MVLVAVLVVVVVLLHFFLPVRMEQAALEEAGFSPELAALVVPGIADQLGAPVVNVALQRWKFSEPAATFAQPCVWLPDLGLGLAGDAFGGPRVEGAALSGWAMAERMAVQART